MPAQTSVDNVHKETKLNINHNNPPPHPTDKSLETNSNGIKCLYTNTDQLVNKLEEVILFVKENNVHIIAINETLPKSCSSDVSPAFIIPGYECFPDNEGRGVCVFVKDIYETKRISDIEDLFHPSIFLKINLSKQNSFIFSTIYRSPNCLESDHDNIRKQINTVSERFSKTNDKIVICGDFNYPAIDWSTGFCSNNEENKANKFLNTVHENFLHQMIDEPTHYRGLQNPTLIDLILTNDSNFVHSVEHNPPFGKSHHSVISFCLDIEPPHITPNTTIKSMVDKGDYESMRDFVYKEDTVWDRDFDCPAEECWTKLNTIINTAVQKYVPTKVFKPFIFKINKHAPPTLLNKIRLKRRAFKFYKKFPTKENYDRYARFRNQVKNESRKTIRNKEKYIASNAKSNPKSFFKYVSSKTKNKVNISNLKKKDGSLTENNLEKADVLKTFFTSVFTKEPDGPLPHLQKKTDLILDNITITQDQMFRKLSSLKTSKSPGPDGLHPRVIRELAPVISYPLTLLFHKSVKESKLPSSMEKC